MSGDEDGAGPDLEAIAARLRREAGRAEGFGKIVKLDFGEDGVLVVDAVRSPPEIVMEDRPAHTVLRANLSDFVRIARGELDPARAVLTGKLKIAGDMGAAMALARLFRNRE